MINEQELAKAVEVLNEGGKALDVSCEDVYRKMLSNEPFTMKMMEEIHAWNSCVDFNEKFDEIATDLLREAYRTKLEHGAGL